MITPSQRQILEAVLEALPENKKHESGQTDARIYTSQELLDMSIGQYNKALYDVRAIINEFLEPEDSK